MSLPCSKLLEDYPISHLLNQRVVGPIGNCQANPPTGSEVFVSRLPLHYTEVELFSIFSTIGNIFKLRVMLRECSTTYMYNRGFAYVTYTTPQEAEKAVREISEQYKYTGTFISVEISHDNCRLFVGGIPEHRSKDEVWKQLIISGFEGIVEIIMYRAYTNRAINRGYVFVEFETHQKAAQARFLFQNYKLWGNRLTVDWSTPLPRLDEVTLSTITKLFFRNMSVTELPEQFNATLLQVLDGMPLRKVYKFKDYAFVHFYSRQEAEVAKKKLTEYYADTAVEISWATPQHMAPKKRYSCISPTPVKKSNAMFNRRSIPSNSSRFLDESLPSTSRSQQLPSNKFSPPASKVFNPLFNNPHEQFKWSDFMSQPMPANCQQFHRRYSTPNKTNEHEWQSFFSDTSSVDRYQQFPHCSTPINHQSNPLNNINSPLSDYYSSYGSQSSSSSVNYQQLLSPPYSLTPNKNDVDFMNFSPSGNQSSSQSVNYQQFIAPQFSLTPNKNDVDFMNFSPSSNQSSSQSVNYQQFIAPQFSLTPNKHDVDVMNFSPSFSSPTQPTMPQRSPQVLDYLRLVRPQSPIETVPTGINIEDPTFDSLYASHIEQLNSSAIKDEYLPLDQVFRTLALGDMPNTMKKEDKEPTVLNESGIQSYGSHESV